MNGVRALIAEDEAPQRRALCALLSELWPELRIVAECADGLTALEAFAAERPEIVFLDIRMPGLSGLEIARAASQHAHVVFTTAYDEYAVTAFDAGALDYLLKPIRRERLERTLERLKERVRERPPALESLLDALQSQASSASQNEIRWITGSAGNVTKIFGIEEVLFFQAQDKYVRVVTADDEVHIRTPLRELLTGLNAQVFWQVHRSAIVRAGAIRRIEADETGKLNLRVRGRADVLPVSQAFQFRFKPM